MTDSVFDKSFKYIIQKKYPFVKDIEIIRMRKFLSEVSADIDFTISREFIEKHVQKSCYDQMDEIFFSLWSFNYCSDVKMEIDKVHELFKIIYKMTHPYETVHTYNLSLSVLSDDF